MEFVGRLPSLMVSRTWQTTLETIREWKGSSASKQKC
jgi:hypothetical protein